MRAAGVYDCVFPPSSPFVMLGDAIQRLSGLPFWSDLQRCSAPIRVVVAPDGGDDRRFRPRRRHREARPVLRVNRITPATTSRCASCCRRPRNTIRPRCSALGWRIPGALPGAERDSSHDYKILLGLIADATGDTEIGTRKLGISTTAWSA